MDDVKHSVLGRSIIVALSIILGLIVVWFILKPLLGLSFLIIWTLSGLIAFIFKVLLFIALSFVAIMGFLILLSWLIREFLD